MGFWASEKPCISILEVELKDVDAGSGTLRSHGPGAPQLHRGMMPPLQA
ncbi:MAG: hypothetical protein ACK46L_03565 [Synechococcaceae cyanobacterium]